MNRYEVHCGVDDEIRNVLKGISTDKYIDYIAGKGEKITHDLEQDRYYINTFFPSFPGKHWDVYMAGLKKVGEGKRVPFQTDLVVTGRCHCDCWHCFRAKYSDSNELGIETIRQIIGDLEKLGNSVVGITGGEPMLRKDIVDIIKMIPDSMEGQIYTTGININDEFVEKIKGTSLRRCIISLDHYDEKVVCRTRNSKRAFSDVMNAVTALKKSNIYVSLTICINKDLITLDELEKYVEFVRELGVNEIRMVSTISQGKLEGQNFAKDHLYAMKIIREVKKKTSNDPSYPAIVNFGEIESARYLGCGAGVNYISVNADGGVNPCVSVPLSFGNVNEDTFENIYNDMGRFFPKASCSCVGMATDVIRKKMDIEIEEPPFDKETSIDIISKCQCSMRSSDFFEKVCK